MLHGLVGDPEKEAQVAEVAADEVGHITRLLRWLKPFEASRSRSQIHQIISAFQSKLDQRMFQFLPREELRPLRDRMAALTDKLLSDLTVGFR
jgi:hypothetical protein